jgi:hypothetical protein
MWEHFETYHELMRPTYMSKYPPAQGLSLAFATLLHLPLLGSFGMVALGCAATYWMLLGWMPARWALLGGLLAATHPEIFNWGEGYWTGGVGLLGGALVSGVAIRMISRPTRIGARHGIISGIGIALLANHRPFEGLVTIVLLALIGWCVTRNRPGLYRAICRMVLPFAAILLPAFVWMGYYNWRVTGHVTELPYQLYENQYSIAPEVYWQSARPIPNYRHPAMRELYVEFWYASYLRLGTLRGFIATTSRQFYTIFSELFNSPLLLAPAVLGFLPIGKLAHRRRRATIVASSVPLCSVIIHLASSPYLDFHYIQSAAPMFIAWIVLSLRQLSSWRIRQWMVGRTLVIAVVGAQLGALAAAVAVRVLRPSAPGETRQRLVEQLNKLPGKQLVLVRYTPGSQLQTLFEWVYNDADPDRSKTVWARSMGTEKDNELLNYYRDRHPWQLDVDGTRLSLTPAKSP